MGRKGVAHSDDFFYLRKIILLYIVHFLYKEKSLFLIIAEKRQITKTAVIGGWRQIFLFLSVYYHNKKLHVKFGCSRAVLKFGGWQLKNGKITGKKWKIGQGVVKRS